MYHILGMYIDWLYYYILFYYYINFKIKINIDFVFSKLKIDYDKSILVPNSYYIWKHLSYSIIKYPVTYFIKSNTFYVFGNSIF